jgi:hypothetical protein
MGVDDFELLTMIGKGAFGEVYVHNFMWWVMINMTWLIILLSSVLWLFSCV